MLTVDEVFRELQKIARQRALVKASHLTDAMKSKLTSQLDDQAKALEAKVLDPSPVAPKALAGQPDAQAKALEVKVFDPLPVAPKAPGGR